MGIEQINIEFTDEQDKVTIQRAFNSALVLRLLYDYEVLEKVSLMITD